ncbi:hypothetical protein CQA49_02315 [Helicobacter sp. MIT 00-7814]|uniref:hypothetical protein n=1 Tax=unclassified Helicobacter TaxID=2593540 RepID=UPI000E1F4F08|nr:MULTISPECIES: hypothetical protein [unclassified Helicobacter]RDU55224.1 hypothetical protein CQA37_04005 [Helicobacter sp. MIT 99-10781]RDU56062.1 hypothetical protein CQA49_02315 [Helicobacter sp. MIT 00-7814]
MQMLNINENQELQGAKNFMFWSLISYIICCLVCGIPFVNFFAFIGIIASFVTGMVGLYRFSKLCNTFVFRLTLISFLLGIGLFIVGMTCIILTQVTKNPVPLVILVILAIVYCVLVFYWYYLVSYEMSARTNLKEFITSFKLSLIWAIGMLSVPWLLLFLLGQQAALISVVVLFIVSIAAVVFLAMGLYKIQEVSVREVNICKLEKTSNARD